LTYHSELYIPEKAFAFASSVACSSSEALWRARTRALPRFATLCQD
jgi:hypothetical protein